MPYAAQYGFFVHLEAGKMVAQHHRFSRIGIARPLKSFQLGTAALQYLIKLQWQLTAQKLYDRHAHHQINAQISFRFGAVEAGDLQIYQHSLELSRLGRLGPHLAGILAQFRRRAAGLYRVSRPLH